MPSSRAIIKLQSPDPVIITRSEDVRSLNLMSEGTMLDVQPDHPTDLATYLYQNLFSDSSGTVVVFNVLIPRNEADLKKTKLWLKSLEPKMMIALPSMENVPETKKMKNLADEGANFFEIIEWYIKRSSPDLPLPLRVNFNFDGLPTIGSLQIKMAALSPGYWLRIGWNILPGQAKNDSIKSFIRLLTGIALGDQNVHTGQIQIEIASRLKKIEKVTNPIRVSYASKPTFAALVREAQNGSLLPVIKKHYGSISYKRILSQWRRGRGMKPGSLLSIENMHRQYNLPSGSLYSFCNEDSKVVKRNTRDFIEKLAAVMEIDVNVLFYMVNRDNYPDLSEHLTRTASRELLIDHGSLAHALKILQQTAGSQLNKDIRYKILQKHIDRYGALYDSTLYAGYSGITLIDFIALNTLPLRDTAIKLAAFSEVPINDIYDFLYKTHLSPKIRDFIEGVTDDPDVAQWLKRKGIHTSSIVLFKQEAHFGAVRDRVSDLEEPYDFGCKIMFLRMYKDLSLPELSALTGISKRDLSTIEMGHYDDGVLDARTIGLLANGLDMEVSVLKKWLKAEEASNSYGRLEVGRAFQAERGSLSEMMYHALPRAMDMAAIADACTSAMGEVIPGFLTTGALISQVFTFGRKAASDDEKKPPVDDSHLAAFLLAFGENISASRFWKRVRRDLLDLFPTLQGSHPYIQLSHGATWQDLLRTSVPMAITQLIVGDVESPLDKMTLAEKFGLSNPNLISLNESRDYVSRPANLIQLATSLGLDPKMAYLARYPWILLGMTVKDEKGTIIDFFGLKNEGSTEKDYLKKQANLIAQQLARFANHADLIQSAVVQQATSLEILIPDNPALVKRLQKYDCVLNDEELAILAGIDELEHIRKPLLENSRKGPLQYFMGRHSDGEIDYSIPDGWSLERIKKLDLLQIARDIAKNVELSFGVFWNQQTGYSVNGEVTFKEKLQRGFTVPNILHFSRLAQKAGHTYLTPKILYLYFRGALINAFVPLQPQESPQRTETKTKLELIAPPVHAEDSNLETNKVLEGPLSDTSVDPFTNMNFPAAGLASLPLANGAMGVFK